MNLGEILRRTKKLNAELGKGVQPPDEGSPPRTEQVLPHSLVRNTRGYLESIVFQINGTYENGCYDACAVMLRRLLETLIIEAYEAHKMAEKIQDSDGNFLMLGTLIDRTLSEPAWNLGRNTKRALRELKGIGDRSAHGRRFVAHRIDVEKHVSRLRDATQELVFLARLK